MKIFGFLSAIIGAISASMFVLFYWFLDQIYDQSNFQICHIKFCFLATTGMHYVQK